MKHKTLKKLNFKLCYNEFVTVSQRNIINTILDHNFFLFK